MGVGGVKRKRIITKDITECHSPIIKVPISRILTNDSGKVNGVCHLNKHQRESFLYLLP